MPGVKGRTGTHKNRSNGWIAGTVERLRTEEVFSFKPKMSVIEEIKKDMEQRQLTKTEWLDMAAEIVLGITTEESTVETSPAVAEFSPVVRDAIATAIGLKQAAIRAEKKKKPSQRDQALIDKWEVEIQELESFL